MQTLTADLIEEQKRQDQLYYRKVEIAKRYWHAGEGKYKWDTLENIDKYISEDHGGVSTARWKQDSRAFNQWKSPSFQVEVDDRRNYWSEIETGGIWLTGTNQPYRVELTKIRVRCGHYLPDETEEDKYIFSGLINQPPAYHDKTKTATLYCIGYDEKLRRVNAELLSILVPDGAEELGSGGGTEFTTDNNGVGGIPPKIKKGLTGSGHAAATLLKAGTDYTLSDTNKKNLPLKVTLAVALNADESVWGEYRYWYQDKELSWIVEQLLILAEITSYNVDPTIFAVDIENTWTQTTKADWDAYESRSNTNNDKSPGDVVIDSQSGQIVYNFEGGTYAGWAVEAGSWAVVSYAGSYRLKQTSFPATALIRTTSKLTWGEWSYKWMGDSATLPSTGSSFRLHEGRFISDASNNYYAVAVNGKTFDDTKVNLRLIKYVGSETTLAGPVEIPYTAGTPYTFKVTRTYSNGVSTIKVYVNNVEKLSASDDAITSSEYFKFYHCQAAANTVQYVDDVNIPLYHATGNFVTQRHDAGVDITAWGKLTDSTTEPGDSDINYETISSANSAYPGDAHADWIAIAANNQIQSAVHQYLWVRPTLSSSSGREYSPSLHALTVYYYTSTITIPLVNLTGMNVEQGIQRCAEMPAYEIGFDVDESYFYRQRTSVGAPVLTIDSKTNLEKELSFNSGTKQRKNVIDVTFGPYRTVIDPDTEGESHPHSKDEEGEKKYTVSGSTLLPPESADVATATAKTLYAYLSVEKKRARVQMKFLLQYQLGDVANYLREHKFGRWLLGDTDRHLGDYSDPDFVFYSTAATMGWDIIMRIEGIEFDTNPKKMRMRFDLVERIE